MLKINLITFIFVILIVNCFNIKQLFALNNITITNNFMETNNSKHLRQLFDFSGTQRPATHQLFMAPSFLAKNKKQRSSTFRPTSSILYLHPPKPRHIAAIHSEFLNIDIGQDCLLILTWKICVTLKSNQSQNSHLVRRDIVADKNLTNFSKTLARVEEEKNPLRWQIFFRRYGLADRKKIVITDNDNTLNPPYTSNKTYEHRIEKLKEGSSYELCFQSVNGGRFKESEQIRKNFPVNANTNFAGKNNPLLICKEILIIPSQIFQNKTNLKKFELTTKNKEDNKKILDQLTKVSGKSGNQIEVSNEVTDAFVVYTAISSGSTTLLILIVVAIFCCCKCNRHKSKHQEYHRYNRALSGDSNFYFQ